jgi:hypothetical protein
VTKVSFTFGGSSTLSISVSSGSSGDGSIITGS